MSAVSPPSPCLHLAQDKAGTTLLCAAPQPPGPGQDSAFIWGCITSCEPALDKVWKSGKEQSQDGEALLSCSQARSIMTPNI